ncbi:MAG: hypothetical protein VR73_14330 [Gammaproteobacteria bacterium BRH_c0]|nr:MAG: hypothetical protein VR73_14330 [Gammaproteobacteria bacterium BRH_c0]
MMKNCLRNLSLLALLAVLPAHAAELKTEWIEPREGFAEQTLGARIKSVETMPGDQGQRVTIEIPRGSMTEEESMQEIVVTARQPDQSESEIEVRHEWVKDYQNDFYGLVLYLGKNSNLPIRIYLKSSEQPDTP